MLSSLTTALRAGRGAAVSMTYLFVAVAILLIPGNSLLAQLAGKGEIKGVIADTTGAVVPNASVTATSTTRGVAITRVTNSAGEYDLTPLDADIYTITVKVTGFQTTTQENIHVNSLEIANVNIALTVGSTDESVTVSAAPPALESSNATLGATLEQQTYAALPIQMGAYGQAGARRATDFVALLPGVQFNETNGNATTNSGVVNGGGARGATSDIYINGMPFISVAGEGDPRFVWSAISVDAINQLQVQTLGYSAIYEGQGVQNYTTKAGTNSFHGSLYEYFRNTVLDTWGFFNKYQPALAKPIKPVEHQNEFGITLGGPILKNKLFFFGNYNGYRYSRGPQLAYQTNPTTAETQGDFSALGVNIYDPASCPNGNTNNCQRTQFAGNKIPASRFSTVAKNLQQYLPPLTNQNATSNYLGGYNTGLNNYSTTERIDYTLNDKHNMTFTFAAGRQSTTAPASQTLSSSNAGTTFNQSPVPYIDVQEFAPKTKVIIFEDNYTFTPKLVNQFKYGFARYFGPSFNLSQGPYGAQALGISGLPAGQAANAFPNVRFSGTDSPNYWAGYTGNTQATNAYTLLDNLNYSIGKHSITGGVQIAWLQYNYTPQTGGSTPLQVTFASAQVACYAASTSSTSCYSGAKGTTSSASVVSGTGLPYASYLLGAVNAATFTNTTVVETGARFRPISPYVQDDWRVTTKLTVNLGLRWDYYPTYLEVHDRLSFMNPNLTNPNTGTAGGLQFAGNGTDSCNCRTNVNNYFKNLGPRVGFAYSAHPETIIRGSFGIIYAHGNGVGGSSTSRQGSGLLGFAATPNFVSPSAALPAFNIDNGIPAYSLPPFLNAGYGTGYYTTTAGGKTVASGAPQTVAYGDPYLGARAPEFVNWSMGIQQAFTRDLTLTATYVGSQGHFLQPDSISARGKWINQLSPNYLSLGTNLSTAVNKLPANFLAANNIALPYGNFDQSQSLAQALKPFAQYNSITDAYGFVANSNYHAIQTSLAQRTSNGVNFMINYTWSHNIDDAGTFRSGYDIPAAYSQTGKAVKADRGERSDSLANRTHNLVGTGVFDSPFSKGGTFGDRAVTRALFGGFKLSTIVMVYSGSPLAITAATCGTNPAQSTCLPTLNPAFTGPAKTGEWGHGVTAATAASTSFINSSAFIQTPAYVFANAPRTAPYKLYGPGNYNLDLSLRRSFGVPYFETSHLILEADLYNVTNHTQFGTINTTFGNSNFGTVGNQANLPRDAQLAARYEF